MDNLDNILRAFSSSNNNNISTRHRRKMFLSTYSLNSNESSISIDSYQGTPPLRRHSNFFPGSKLTPVPPPPDQCDKPKNIPERKKNIRKRRKSSSVIKVSNTIAACNYMAKTSHYRQSKANNHLSRKTLFSKKATKVINESLSTPPLIVIDKDKTDGDINEEGNGLRRKDSLSTIALKVRDKSLGKDIRPRRKSQGDMSHIRAKWLLGFNLTMVNNVVSKNYDARLNIEFSKKLT